MPGDRPKPEPFVRVSPALSLDPRHDAVAVVRRRVVPHRLGFAQDLFDPDGSELYLKPASDFVQLGTAVNFYTVVEAARRQGAVAIGYRLDAEAYNPDASYGVKINPLKSQSVTFGPDDRIVVLAEN